VITNAPKRPAETSGRTFAVTDPATLETIDTVPDDGPAEALAAVDRAAAAFPAWSALSGRERGRVLLKLGSLVREATEELAGIVTAECGKPLKQARDEVRSSAAFVTWYGEEAKRGYGSVIPAADRNKRITTIHIPAGVAAAISPWNFPLGLLSRKIAAALAAGCTVVAKPAEATPLVALAFARLAAKAGVPDGALNVVTGAPAPIVETWMRDPRVTRVSFTGSTEVGKLLAGQAAHTLKRLTLELGGSAPYLVFADADLDAAVEGLALSKVRNAGQVCAAPNRIYVHADVLDRFLDKLRAMLDGVAVGDPRSPETRMGPLISEDALRGVRTLIDEARAAGAQVEEHGRWVGGAHERRGWFLLPHLIVGIDERHRLVRDEAFGPIFTVLPFSDEHDVVARANDSPYALGAYLFTNDLNRAVRVSEALQAGLVGVNDALPASVEAPFGGYLASGYGREGGAAGLFEFLEEKTISVRLS
jgi:succinate-semialdehyde dehydrogenase/glutarate-semialdehyde dehydrogenase